MIEFRLDARSGVAPYLQLIHQVRHALRLGLLREGDQLPRVKDASAGLAINPNTVLKAYRLLEHEGLVAARPGIGTFVTGEPWLETGTAALAWNQSVTRSQWLAAKLAVGGLASMAVTEGLNLMQAWWAAPIGRAVGLGATGSFFAVSRFNSLTFASHGITPLGYAAFSYALGVAAGALVRRVVPAMAVTLAIFAAAQVAMPLWIRPSLLPAEHAVVSVTSLRTITLQGGGPHSGRFQLGTENLPSQPGAWILSASTVNAAGQATSTTPAACTTRRSEESTHAFIECLASQGIRESVAYQPVSRYWAFQQAETANLPRHGPGPFRLLLLVSAIL